MYREILLIIVLVTLLTGCSSTRHNIAGTTRGWNSNDISVLSDVQVSGLQVKLVRRSNVYCTQGYQDHLELNGPIGPDSTFVVGDFLKKINQCVHSDGGKAVTTVYMNSFGGLLNDGYSLGRMFRKHGVSARVIDNQVCASSCAVAFLGAYSRRVMQDAVLVFHAPYSVVYEEDYYPNKKKIKCDSEINSANLENYFIEMLGRDVGTRLFQRTMSYCSNIDGWTLNSDAAFIYGITNPEVTNIKRKKKKRDCKDGYYSGGKCKPLKGEKKGGRCNYWLDCESLNCIDGSCQ